MASSNRLTGAAVAPRHACQLHAHPRQATHLASGAQLRGDHLQEPTVARRKRPLGTLTSNGAGIVLGVEAYAAQGRLTAAVANHGWRTGVAAASTAVAATPTTVAAAPTAARTLFAATRRVVQLQRNDLPHRRHAYTAEKRRVTRGERHAQFPGSRPQSQPQRRACSLRTLNMGCRNRPGAPRCGGAAAVGCGRLAVRLGIRWGLGHRAARLRRVHCYAAARATAAPRPVVHPVAMIAARRSSITRRGGAGLPGTLSGRRLPRLTPARRATAAPFLRKPLHRLLASPCLLRLALQSRRRSSVGWAKTVTHATVGRLAASSMTALLTAATT